ncbi:MAG: hypothetical protein P4K97_11105, partial [Terracidiphilus sp.]|nr:hypothetical protein [Terracidiphilus sp.]
MNQRTIHGWGTVLVGCDSEGKEQKRGSFNCDQGGLSRLLIAGFREGVWGGIRAFPPMNQRTIHGWGTVLVGCDSEGKEQKRGSFNCDQGGLSRLLIAGFREGVWGGIRAFPPMNQRTIHGWGTV